MLYTLSIHCMYASADGSIYSTTSARAVKLSYFLVYKCLILKENTAEDISSKKFKNLLMILGNDKQDK